nr:premnaspirodiene oxygenase [Quercus suber]
MKTNDAALANRPTVLAIKVMCYDNSSMVFCPYGDYWRQMRKICVMELLSPKRVQSFRTIREEEVWNLIEYISSSEAEGLAIDFTEKIVSLTNSITVGAVIGKKCKYEKELVSLIQDTFNRSGGFDVPDLFPSLKFLGFLTGTKPALFKMHRMLLKLQETKELELNITKNHIKAVTLEKK